MKRFAIGAAGVALSLAAYAATPVRTHDYAVGPLKIGHPWSRATPAGAKVGGGYLSIENTGATADRLVSVSVPFAARSEIHEMAVKDGVMTMRGLPDGLVIKPGDKAELKPGSYHVMLIDLKAPLKEGEAVSLTLSFDDGSTQRVDAPVRKPHDGAPTGHGHGKSH